MAMMKNRYSKTYYLVSLGFVLLLLGVAYFRHGRNLDVTCRPRPRDAVESTFPSHGVSFFETDNPYKEQDEWRTFLKALDQYKKFHRKKLAQLKSGSEEVRTLTWSCTQSRCSGLGDQLLRIQFFLPLAMMSDRIFTIHWDSGLEESTKFLLPNQIDWTYFSRDQGMCGIMNEKDCSHHIYESNSVWGFGWTKGEFENFGKVLFGSQRHVAVTGIILVRTMDIMNDTLLDLGKDITSGLTKLGVKQILSKEVNNTIHCNRDSFWYKLAHTLGVDKIIEVPNNSAGHMQIHDPWIYYSHTVFTYLFKFPHSLVSKVAKYQRSLGLYNKAYMSLHLRTGFLGTADKEKWMERYTHSGSKLFTDKRQWDCLVSHSMKLRNETLGPDAPIYISTDSYLVKEWADANYPNHHLVLGNLTLQHSQTIRSRCSENSSSRLGMWLDFFTLAQAKVLVHPDSSFSVSASFLRPIPHANHSWVVRDKEVDCLAAYRSGRVHSCIC